MNRGLSGPYCPCSTYPVHDSAWLANCEQEAFEAVRALRHHACLALWCGNNELEQGSVGDTWTASTMPWDQYKDLFDVMLRDVVEVRGHKIVTIG